MADVATRSVYDAVIGQEHALAKLRAMTTSPVHAYLLIGPPGCGKEIAARAFVASRLQGSEDANERTADLVMRGIHIDVHELEREGAAISVDQAREELIKLAQQSAVEGAFRSIIVHDIHLLADVTRGAILKTVEEPGASNLIVLLGDDVPDSMITIASRCVRIDFAPITDEVIQAQLIIEGTDLETAQRIAFVASGDLARARILVGDTSLAQRTQIFSQVPFELDGTTSRALLTAESLLATIEESLDVYKEQQAQEIVELDKRAKFLGERGSGRRDMEDRHKRELRRHRTDELRSGLRIMTLVYADALKISTQVTAHHLTDSYVRAVKTLRDASTALSLNVGDKLLLENLLMALPTVVRDHASGSSKA